MVNLLKSLLGDGREVIGLLVRVLAGVTVIRVWMQTHAKAAVLGTLFIGAVTIYGVDHFDDLGDEVKETIDEHRDAPPIPAQGER